MAQTYTRQSTFSDGDTITASLFNDEYNQLVNAFAYSSTDATSTGHRHDGTAAQGGNIPKIGDLDFLNKIEVDSTNNRWGFYVEVSSAAVEQIRIQDGAIVPVTDNDIDLGTSSLEFKDLYIDGTANIDTLSVDTSATIAGLTVSGTSTLQGDVYLGNASADTIFVPGLFQANLIPENDSLWNLGSTSLYWANAYVDAVTTTGDVAIGGNLTVTGNATISGNLTFGDADTDSITLTADVASHITPDTDDTYDLGSSTKEWRNLYIDGTANIDSLVADTADINAGSIDNTTVGATTASTGNFSTLSIAGTAITATAAELNIMDGVTATATEINLLDGVTSTTAELNILDGVTSTATELNIVDGDTTATSTTLADADRVVVNDAGTMVQVALTDFETYFESALDTLSNVTTVGALNAGSITSGFGAIDNGSSAITTTGTVTYGNLSDGTITITAFVDEDDMSSDSATLVPTQQSVKAYVDSQVTAQDLDFQADTGGALSIDLDSETMTFTGGTGIDTSGSGNAVTFAIDSTVATLTGTQTLTNKTLTSPDVNTPDIDGGTIDNTVIGGSTAAAGTFTTFTSTGIDDNASSTAMTISSAGATTFSGDVVLEESTPRLQFIDSDITDSLFQFAMAGGTVYVRSRGGTSNYGDVRFQRNNDGSTHLNVFRTTTAGDVIFYDDDGSTEGMRWDASHDRLGIGVQSPLTSLHISEGDVGAFTSLGRQIATFERSSAAFINLIAGTTASTGIDFGDVDDVDAGSIRFDNNDDSLAFRIADDEKLRITSSGNVLIGRTTQTLSGGNGDDLQIGSGSGGAGLTIHSSTTGTGDIQFADGTTGNTSYRGLVRYDHTNDSLDFWANSAEKMSIASDGDVTISGNIEAGDGTDISMSSSSVGQLRLLGDGYQGAIALDATGLHLYHNSASRSIIFGTNETERFRIAANGALAIGGASNYGTSGQVLTSNGNGAPSWQTPSTGIALTDLSVTTNSVGTAALSYNNSTGVFSYTPPNLTNYATTNANDDISAHWEFQDTYQLRFGNSADSRMYWDGTNNRFIHRNYTHGSNMLWQAENNSGTNVNMLYLEPDDGVYLYYAGSTKLQTSSSGITVTGGVATNDTNVFSRTAGQPFYWRDSDATNATNCNVYSYWYANTTPLGYIGYGSGSDSNLYLTNSGHGNLYLGANSANGFLANGYTIWHSGNDGSGSGLDADTLDGNQASAFATLSGATFTGVVNFRSNVDLADNDILRFGSGDDFEMFCNGAHMYMDLNGGIGNLYIRDGTTTRYTFNDNGSFTATGNVTAYSDVRLKEDIETLDGSKVYEMRGVSFTKEGKAGSGVIAQELQKVAPELVEEQEEDGYLSVAYGNIVGYLIEAVKEQKKEIDRLKEIIECQ